MSDCSKHKKDLFGQTDMKLVAEAIGNLHYETLAELLAKLQQKIWEDSLKDRKAGRLKLSAKLHKAATCLCDAYNNLYDAYQISKRFMESNNQ